ncbi:MAG: hypothetical protein VX628_02720, partial [Cyanobacteriota bacterium]|nr:hypothetical protein [Cyanobacteriota bacterium]
GPNRSTRASPKQSTWGAPPADMAIGPDQLTAAWPAAPELPTKETTQPIRPMAEAHQPIAMTSPVR